MIDPLRKTLAGTALAAIAVVAALPASAQQGPTMSLLPKDQPSSRPTGIWSIFQPVAPRPEPVEDQPATVEVEAEEPQPKYKLVKVPLPPVVPRRAPAPVVAPQPKAEPQATEVQPDAAEPAAEAEAPESPPATSYKLAKVPLPPVVDRRAGAAQAGKAGGQTAAEPAKSDLAVAEPPQPRPTGIFAMFAAYSQPEGSAPSVMSDADTARPVLALPETTRVAPQPAAPISTRTTRLDLSDPFRPKKLPLAPGEKDDDLEDEEDAPKLVEKQVDSVEISCLKPELMAMIYKAGDHFGATPVITSGYRNRGRRGSHHRKCEAADFFIPDVSGSQLVSFLRKLPGAGGVGTYCHTKSVHLDTGEPRNWHQCGFRRSFALRAPVTEIGSR